MTPITIALKPRWSICTATKLLLRPTNSSRSIKGWNRKWRSDHSFGEESERELIVTEGAELIVAELIVQNSVSNLLSFLGCLAAYSLVFRLCI